MSCLNKHSAQLEEVWLGGSRFYVHMEVTSYTNWKTRVSLHFFFHGRTANGVPCSFLHNWSSGDSVKGEGAAPGGGCSKVTFAAGVWAHSWGEHEEKGWAEQHRAFPCCGANRLHPPSLPQKGNQSLKTPQVFFWPCKTLMFNVVESWKWEHQSSPSCSVKCSMSWWKKQMFVTNYNLPAGLFFLYLATQESLF